MLSSEKFSPLFTEQDYQCLRRALRALSDREFRIVVMRFWELNTIEEIATALKSSWTEIDRTIEGTLPKLRQICLMNPDFSRHRARKEKP